MDWFSKVAVKGFSSQVDDVIDRNMDKYKAMLDPRRERRGIITQEPIRSTWTATHYKNFTEDWNNGVTIRKMGFIYSVTPGHVPKIARRLGLKMRSNP